MRNSTLFLSALFLATTASAMSSLPRPEDSEIQELKTNIHAAKDRVNTVLQQTGGNQGIARSQLRKFSQKLDHLNELVNKVETLGNDDGAYGRTLKKACLETRRLFLLNSQAELGAGNGITRDNPVFDDNRSDVNGVRSTLYCDTYEIEIDNQNAFSHSKWKSTYSVGNQQVAAEIEFNGSEGTYKTSGFTGTLINVVYFDDHISALYQGGNSGGWVEFPIDDAVAMDGMWGNNQLGEAINGKWWGRKK